LVELGPASHIENLLILIWNSNVFKYAEVEYYLQWIPSHSDLEYHDSVMTEVKMRIFLITRSQYIKFIKQYLHTTINIRRYEDTKIYIKLYRTNLNLMNTVTLPSKFHRLSTPAPIQNGCMNPSDELGNYHLTLHRFSMCAPNSNSDTKPD